MDRAQRLLGLLLLALILPAQARDAREVRAFKKNNPCPYTREQGCIVDHVIPLCAGGPDKRTNMQWQTLSNSRAKDREEYRLCASLRGRK